MQTFLNAQPDDSRGEIERLLSENTTLRGVVSLAETIFEDHSHNHTLDAPFPMAMPLERGITAYLVWPGVDPEVVRGGLRVCHSAFNDEHIDERMSGTYSRALQRNNFVKVEDPSFSDYGRTLENCGFCVYYQSGQAVGISGLYRYLDQPQVFWLGRLGIVQERQGQGLGRVIVGHLAGLAASIGGAWFKAYTEEEGPGAAEVHQFYERAGFSRAPEGFVDEEVPQRVYQIKL